MNCKSIGSIAILMAILAVSILSCDKHKDIAFQKTPNSVKHVAGDQGGGGREDDDGPIVVHNAVSPSMQPLAGATVKMINSGDTLQLVTDSSGQSTFRLPGTGSWNVQITRPGYLPLDTLIQVVSPYSIQTNVLQQQ